MISVALKIPLQKTLGICIYKTSLLHRPDDYIGFTPSCPPQILQQNCAHALHITTLYIAEIRGRLLCILKGLDEQT